MSIYYESSVDLLNGKGRPGFYDRDVFPTPYPLPPISEAIIREMEAEYNHYIFVDKVAKDGSYADFYCTKCGNSIHNSFRSWVRTDERTIYPDTTELISAQHNGYSHCPVCHCVGEVKRVNKLRRYDNYSEWRPFIIFQQAGPNEVFIRCISSKRNRTADLRAGTSYGEWEFYRLTPGRCEFFRHGYGGWSSYTNENVQKADIRKHYKILGVNDLKGSFLEYSVTPEYAGKYSYTVCLAACFAAMYPCAEMLYKFGFTQVISEWIASRKKNCHCLNLKAESFSELWKIPKDTLNYLLDEMKKDSSIKHCISEVFRGLKLFGMDIEGCKLAIEFDGYHFWGAQKDLREAYTLLYGAGKYDRKLLVQLIRYVQKNEKNKANSVYGFGGAMKYYLDYVREGSYVSLDFNAEVVRFPKSLVSAHDNAARLASMMRAKATQKAFDKLYKKHTERYGFEELGYKVIAPKSTKDIVDEGKAMGHCVGGYADRHAEGKLAILFIRKVSDIDTPYVTVEVNGSNVKQVQGRGNKRTWEKEADHGDSFNQFLADWKKFIKRSNKPLVSAAV